MAAQSFNWTTGAQAWRVAAVDARLTGIDVAYGLFYVLAGFYFPPHNPRHAVQIVAAPLVVLSLVLLYLAYRLCGPEREGQTAMFYANLPRGRALTYWAHAAWLGVFALAMEAVIMLGVALRLNAARPDQPFLLAPYMFILPFFAIAFWLWLIYSRWILEIYAIVVTIMGIVWLIVWDTQLRTSGNGLYPMTALQNVGPAFALALLAVLFLWHGHRRWLKTQVGEVS